MSRLLAALRSFATVILALPVVHWALFHFHSPSQRTELRDLSLLNVTRAKLDFYGNLRVELDKIVIQPLPPGFVPFERMRCVSNFVRITLESAALPTTQGFNDFSWRMAHRQYYLLHKHEFPFEMRTRFLLETGEVEMNAENVVWNDLVFHPEQDYASKMFDYVLEDNCDGFIITSLNTLLTVARIERFSYAARSNEVICPSFQKCGDAGTFVRGEIYKDLKFGPKDAGKVLNQRAEQCRRVNYEPFVTPYDTFDQLYQREFAPRFNKKTNELPPHFAQTVAARATLPIELAPKSHSCASAKLTIFIKTARVHFLHRKVARLMVQTLAVHRAVAAFFVLGNGTTFREEIAHEMAQYDDLLIAGFDDNYENLPLKTLAAYQFGVAHCNPDGQYIIQDDDAFITYHNLADAFPEDKMLCLMGGTAPMSPTKPPNYFRKHWMRIDQWPPGFALLKYCNGPCTAMSGKVFRAIYETALVTRWEGFRIEDFYFNGIVRTKAGVAIGGTQKIFCHHMSGDNSPGQILRQLLKVRHNEAVKNAARKMDIDLSPYLKPNLT